jgi:hypothetical protein
MEIKVGEWPLLRVTRPLHFIESVNDTTFFVTSIILAVIKK